MTRTTQFLLLVMECMAMAAAVLIILPHAANLNNELAADWSKSRRAAMTRKTLEQNATAVGETARALEQALTELTRFGTEEQDLNQLPRELSNLAQQAGLHMERFQHQAPEPLQKGTQEIGRRAAVTLTLLGDYPAMLQWLDLQRERLPSLRIERLLLRRSSGGPDSDKLIVDITLTTPLFPDFPQSATTRDTNR